MSLFAGLYLYEVVMLVLGILLFVMLAIGFFYQLTRKRSLAVLLPFFILPIAMIGYPSIQNIQYKDGMISLQKTTEELERNPTNTAARQDLTQQLAKTTARPISSPQDTAVVARAEYTIGNEQAAKSHLQKALDASPQEPAALELQRKIAVVDNLKQLASQVESEPGNSAAKNKLASTLAQSSQLKLASPAALVQVARAQAALGDHKQALENAQKILTMAPNFAAAAQLQNDIKTRMGPASK